MIEIKGSDVRSNTVMTPGWYVVDVVSMSTKAANTDGSTNYLYKLRVVSDLKGDSSFEEARVKDVLVNEKGIFGSGLAFFAACDPAVRAGMEAMKKDRNAPNLPINENAPVGVRMKAMIKNTTWEGKVSNEASDFLPV